MATFAEKHVNVGVKDVLKRFKNLENQNTINDSVMKDS